jgi:hypothetical protein
MKTEYVVLMITAGFGLFGWATRTFWLFTKELTEWRVKIFDDENGLIVLHQRLDKRVEVIEKRLGWEGEFGRRASDHP